MKEITFNLNDTVKVKLTHSGIELMREHYNNLIDSIVGIDSDYFKKHPFTEPKVDENGYTTFQLHSFMGEFGGSEIYNFNSKQPFETNIILCVED